MKKRLFAFSMAFLLIALTFAGCAATANDSAMREDMDYYYSADTESYYQNTTGSSAPTENYKGDGYMEEAEDDVVTDVTDSLTDMTVDSALQSSRKIILTAEINMETTEFDITVEKLRAAVEELGGYVSGANTYVYNSTYSLREANYTVRIPAENFNTFIARSDDMGNVMCANVWQDDVTSRYTDIAGRLATLETKRDRLLALLEDADIMSDIIELESALSDTIYEIESLTGQLNTYDDRIAYSTAYIHIEEVRDLTDTIAPPKTLGERIAQTFKRAIDDFADFCIDALLFLVGALPTLVVLAVIVIVAIVIIRVTAPRRAIRRVANREKARIAAEKWRADRTAALKANEAKQEDKSDETK